MSLPTPSVPPPAKVGDYIYFSELWRPHGMTNYHAEFAGEWEGKIIEITEKGNWYVAVHPKRTWPWNRENNVGLIDPRQWTITVEPPTSGQTIGELLCQNQPTT